MNFLFKFIKSPTLSIASLIMPRKHQFYVVVLIVTIMPFLSQGNSFLGGKFLRKPQKFYDTFHRSYLLCA